MLSACVHLIIVGIGGGWILAKYHQPRIISNKTRLSGVIFFIFFYFFFFVKVGGILWPLFSHVLNFLRGYRAGCRDTGNDFLFPVPSPFLKLNDNDVKSFLTGYPIF